jgi:hypothetical protein
MGKRSFAYWEGVVTGVVTGIVAAAYLPRLFGSRESPLSAHDVMQAVNDAPEETKSRPFASRRDSPESAGDPVVSGPGGRSGVEFRRAGGPGPRSEAERLAVPGRPGQTVDDTRRMRVSTRTLSLGGKTLARKTASQQKRTPPKHPTD